MQYTSIVADLFQTDIDPEVPIFWQCCPFHNEKTASWNINLQTGLWYCFGCHQGGNLQKLVEKIKGVKPEDAKRIVGKKSRVDIYDPNQYLLTDFEKSSLIKPVVEKVFTGIELPEDFQKIKTHNYLLSRGLTEKDIISDGWGVSRKYPNRVILPLKMRGILYNFLARDITGKSNRKVKNAVGGKPGLCVFGIEAIEKKDKVYVTEGYFDMIGFRQLNLPAVALGWNKITEKQAELLNEFKEIVVVPDNDQGGQFLLQEAQKLMRKSEVNFVEIPVDKKDAGECTKRELIYSIKQKSYPLGKWIASNYCC